MNKLKSFLKRFPLLVRLKRSIWTRLSGDRLPRVYSDARYFPRLFATLDPANSKSIDTSNGLVLGSFQGVQYFLQMSPCKHIETSVFLNRVWEPRIVELIGSYLGKPNQAVLDIGANIGATSIPLAMRHPESWFYLFEPHPQVFRTLQDNCAANRLSNVELVNAAISNRSEKDVLFYAQKESDNMGLSSTKLNSDIGDHDAIHVRSVRVDDAISGVDRTISVIKIDTQGSELDVLQSARATIARYRPMVVFEFQSEYSLDENDERETKAQLLTFFKECRYRIFRFHPGSNYLPALTLNGFFHGDVIAVPLFD